MKRDDNLKIFMGPQEIAGIMGRLHKAFDDMGIINEYVCLCKHKFAYDELPTSKKLKMYWKYRRLQEEGKNKILLFFLEIGAAYDVLLLFIYSLLNYNAYIYIYGHGLFDCSPLLWRIQYVEFFLLKLFKKRVIVLLCGSDSRASYCSDMIKDAMQMRKEVKKQKRKIRTLEKCAILIDNPASSHFHTKRYIRVGCMGLPVGINEIYESRESKGETVVLLHAPSEMKCKGTAIIRKIVKEIKEMGLPIKYIEVSGVPHQVVLEKIAQSDILIDQVYSDTPMAGLAAEAAINGVPTVVSGYYSQYYKNMWKGPIPPSIYCEPLKLKENLIWLIQNKEERKKLGQSARDFVMNNWMAEQCAKRYIDIIQDTYSEEWLFEPSQNEYIWGGGMSKEEIISNVVTLVDQYGMKSLGLSPDSKLYKKYYNLYYNNCKNN